MTQQRCPRCNPFSIQEQLWVQFLDLTQKSSEIPETQINRQINQQKLRTILADSTKLTEDIEKHRDRLPRAHYATLHYQNNNIFNLIKSKLSIPSEL